MNKTEISKEKRISKELQRIAERFSKTDGNRKAIIEPLIQNAAFMRIALEDLQEIINRDGVTETYKNGENQYGVKQSAAVQSYNALIKNYAAVIKTLESIVPPEERKKEEDFPITREKTPEEIQAAAARDEEKRLRIEEEVKAATAFRKKQDEEGYKGSFSQFKEEYM